MDKYMVFKSLKNSFSSKKTQMKTTPQYDKWRTGIFKVDPRQVRVSKETLNRVYGVLMDIGTMDRKTGTPFAFSLTAFSTGEATFHPSVGGGVFGLDNDERVKATTKDLVKMAQTLLDKTQRTEDFSLPETGFVQFFFLTPNGIRIYREHLNTIQTAGNPFRQMLAGFGVVRKVAEGVIDQGYVRRNEPIPKR
ncbi:MAG: hypothetical protein J7M17_01955 [Anaerolineae bacterium]|nr:hypothetical protein [Anaerolineae bacterium]